MLFFFCFCFCQNNWIEIERCVARVRKCCQCSHLLVSFTVLIKEKEAFHWKEEKSVITTIDDDLISGESSTQGAVFNLRLRVRHLPVKSQQNVPVARRNIWITPFYTQYQCWELKEELLFNYYKWNIGKSPQIKSPAHRFWLYFPTLTAYFPLIHALCVSALLTATTNDRLITFLFFLHINKFTGNCCEAPCQNALAFYHCASAYLELLLKALKYLTCWVTLNLAYVNLRVRVALQNVCVPERVAVISRSASQHSFFVVVRLNCTFSKTGFFHYVARGKDLKRRQLLF